MKEESLQISNPSYERVECVVEKPPIRVEHLEPTSTARFLSSLVATISAVTISSPLDVLKTRFQLQNSYKSGESPYHSLPQAFSRIWRQEGVKGFFRGYKATLMTTPLFHSVYFPWYEKLRLGLSEKLDLPKSNFKVVGISSAMAGILCNLITNPLWLVRTRMQAEVFRVQSQAHYSRKYKSVFGSIYKIYSTEGFFALYAGLGASILGISHVCIYFPLYEQFKRYYTALYQTNNYVTNQKKSSSIRNNAVILSSTVTAKFLTTCITYPHEVIRARQQDTRMYDNRPKSVFKVIKLLYSTEGMKAFHKGFSLNLIRMLPQNAVMFLLYENMSNIFTNKCGI